MHTNFRVSSSLNWYIHSSQNTGKSKYFNSKAGCSDCYAKCPFFSFNTCIFAGGSIQEQCSTTLSWLLVDKWRKSLLWSRIFFIVTKSSGISQFTKSLFWEKQEKNCAYHCIFRYTRKYYIYVEGSTFQRERERERERARGREGGRPWYW
jgi:hypothetical protein